MVWHNVFALVPADLALCWIVRLPYFDTPVQAIFHLAAGTWVWTDSSATTRTIALEQVFKWRLV